MLELLAERPRSPTEVAEELGVSVRTAIRNLKSLVADGYAEETRGGEGRGYERYELCELAHLFAGFDGELFERNSELGTVQKAVISVLRVPQPEVHSVLFEYPFDSNDGERSVHPVAFVLYGSVARGETEADSDVDMLVVYDPVLEDSRSDEPIEIENQTLRIAGGTIDTGIERMISEEWFTVSDFQDGSDAGSRFLRNVLDEA